MMQSRLSGREASMLALTVMRLGIGVCLCVAVWQRASAYASLAWLIIFMVADLGDGVVARWLSVDTNLRRIADAVVDRLVIHSACPILMWRVPGAFWLMTPIVARDIVLIVRNCWLLYRKRVIITPGNIHRTGTFLYAVVAGMVLFTTGSIAQWTAAIVAIIVWFLLIDYLRAGRLVSAQPRDMPLARYQAIKLRALRGIAPPRRSSIGA